MQKQLKNKKSDALDFALNFADLDVKDVELFLQEGSKGLPEYAASSSSGAAVGVTVATHSCVKS